MRLKQLSIIIILCASYSLLFSQTDTISAKLNRKSAKVFLMGARISADVNASLKTGQSIIKIDGLTTDYIKGSIVIETKSPGAIKILAVETKLITQGLEKKMKKTQKEIKDSVNLINKALYRLTNQKTSLTKEKEVLHGNGQIENLNKNISPADLKTTMDFYRSRSNDINNEISKVTNKEERLRLIMTALVKRRTNLYKNRKVSSGVFLNVKASKAGKYDFTIKYLVGNCGWTPKYDIRSAGVGGNIDLDFKAYVFNKTERDWKNINLILSTEDPAISNKKPELNDLPSYESMNRMFQGGNNLQNRVQFQDIEFEVVTLPDYSVDFEVPTKYSIPGTGKPYIVEVKSYSSEASYELFAYPQNDKDAYLTGSVIGWNKHNLIDGDANLYQGGAYIGEGKFVGENVNDTLTLTLGRDQKIKTDYKLVKKFTRYRMLGKDKIDYHYQISIRNNYDTKVSIKIEASIPPKLNDKMDIDLTEKSSGKYKASTGEITWTIEIEGNSNKELTIKYTSPKETVAQFATNYNFKYKSGRRRSRAKF